MSQEQAKAFIEKMKSDAAFRERVMAIDDVDARMAFINREGFRCTVDEIKKVQEELKDEYPYSAAKGCAPQCPARCVDREVY